jgi:hypothetical protein
MIRLCWLLIACNGPLVQSDCSQLNIKNNWSLKFSATGPSPCALPSPLPASITVPTPNGQECTPGCICSESHGAAMRDVDKPLVCAGQFTLTCGSAATLNCAFSLDNDTSGSGSCTAGACMYSLDTFARQ